MLLAIHASLSISGFLLCLTGRRAVKGTVYLFISISTSASPLFLAVLTMLMQIPTWVTVAACPADCHDILTLSVRVLGAAVVDDQLRARSSGHRMWDRFLMLTGRH
jgi:hypothetical protein